MKIFSRKKPVWGHLVWILFLSAAWSCGTNEDTFIYDEPLNDSASPDEPDEVTRSCPSGVDFFFTEDSGIVSIEFEDNDFPEGWVLKRDSDDVSGSGYMQWEGNPQMNSPGVGTVVFPLYITRTGTYGFLWRSSFRRGNNGTEHNDSWLRFPDADDYFGQKSGGSRVDPSGSGREPNPNGSSRDGWFKIYRSGNSNAFKWQAATSDNDAHEIFVTFEEEGYYLLEVSARSDYHGIDRLLLFHESLSRNHAIEAADTFSARTVCDN
jgi:hypothetical protein